MLRTHLKGHILRFDASPPPPYHPSAGVRLLLIFLLLEGLLGARLWLATSLGIPSPPAWLRVPALLVVSLILVRFFARLKLVQIGLRAWGDWTTSERSYFIQVFLLANIVFAVLFAPRLAKVSPTYFLWGFYQELMYRGILQTELVRRWGVWAGILLSNLLYTFGPLHIYYFSEYSLPRALLMFVAVFAIGLFFAALFRRSGNLWIVGIFHGIGNYYFSALGDR